MERIKDGQVAVLSVLAAVAVGYALYRWRRNVALRRKLLELQAQGAISAEGPSCLTDVRAVRDLPREAPQRAARVGS